MNLRDFIKCVFFDVYQGYPLVYGMQLDMFLHDADDEELVKLMVDTLKIEKSKGYREGMIEANRTIEHDSES